MVLPRFFKGPRISFWYARPPAAAWIKYHADPNPWEEVIYSELKRTVNEIDLGVTSRVEPELRALQTEIIIFLFVYIIMSDSLIVS